MRQDPRELFERRPPRAILVVKLSAIGDVAQNLFVLPCLRRAFPDARIGWVVSRGCHALLEGHPELDELHVFERERWGGRMGFWRHRREILGLFAQVRRQRYELTLDLQGLARSAIVTAASGARWRAGFRHAREGARASYNLVHDSGSEVRHAIDRSRSLLAWIGAPWPEPRRPSETGAGGWSEASPLAPTSRPRIGLLPFARWSTKRWPLRSFAELASRVQERAEVVVLGSPADAAEARQLTELAPGVVDLCGSVPLAELPGLLRQLDVLVTCDSGPMHIAAAVGTPTVALFGPTDPRRTGPYGDGHVVVRQEVDCAPCLSRRCAVGDLRCLHRIEVDDVERAVAEVLQRRAQP